MVDGREPVGKLKHTHRHMKNLCSNHIRSHSIAESKSPGQCSFRKAGKYPSPREGSKGMEGIKMHEQIIQYTIQPKRKDA